MRPARAPPACMLVRPENTIITSLPNVSWFFWIPSPSPSPAATITVMEMMPQAMPNMVSSVRRFCAHSVTSVSRSKSLKDTVLSSASLLENDLLFFVQPGKDLGLHAVRAAQLHIDLFLPVLALGVRDLHLRFAVLVVDHGGFGRHQYVLLLLQENFRIGAHIGLELAAEIRNRNAHFEGGNVVLLFSERRNLRHLAFELLVLERFNHDAGRLVQIDLADVRFIYLALH